MRTKSIWLALAASCALASPASAATYILNLTGTVGSGSSATVDYAGNRFDFFTISLDGFSPLNLAVGDQIEAVITLDQSLVVPSALVRNGMDFGILNSTLLDYFSTGTSGTTQLFDGANMVVDTASGSGSANNFVNGYSNLAGTSFTFDKVLSNFEITEIATSNQTMTVDYAYLRWLTANPLEVEAAVPEPATWAMMLLGFGAVGTAMRRRPKQTVRVRFA